MIARPGLAYRQNLFLIVLAKSSINCCFLLPSFKPRSTKLPAITMPIMTLGWGSTGAGKGTAGVAGDILTATVDLAAAVDFAAAVV